MQGAAPRAVVISLLILAAPACGDDTASETCATESAGVCSTGASSDGDASTTVAACGLNELAARAEFREHGQPCDPCGAGMETRLSVELSTECEPGVEFRGMPCVVWYVEWRAVATDESGEWNDAIFHPGEREWMVSPGDSFPCRGPTLAELFPDSYNPGAYEFSVYLEPDVVPEIELVVALE